jgi:hypothetical protein
MKARANDRRSSRKLRWSLLGSGGLTLAVLESCDPAVADAVLIGLEDLSISLIQAFFLSIAPESAGSVTVQAVTETLGGMLC